MSFCSGCGIQLAPRSRFCQECGLSVGHAAMAATLRLAPSTHPAAPERSRRVPQASPGIQFAPVHRESAIALKAMDAAAAALEDPVALFVGPRSARYKEKWEKFESDAWPKMGWHWGAFWFTGAWLAYRRMYAYAAIYVLVVFVMTMAFVSTRLPLLPCVAAGFGLQLLLSCYADSIYWRQFTRNLGQIEKEVDIDKCPAAAIEKLQKAGGTNRWAIFILLFAQLAVVGLLPRLIDPAGYARWLHVPTPEADQAPTASDTPAAAPDETPVSTQADSTDLAAMLPLARQGDATAQNNVGTIYLNGTGVEKDMNQAVYWFKKAALQHQPDAENTLGMLYIRGIGVQADPQKAVPLISDAADQGNADAENDLGLMYANGVGVDQDSDMAAQWLRKALAAGSQVAANNLRKLQSKTSDTQN